MVNNDDAQKKQALLADLQERRDSGATEGI